MPCLRTSPPVLVCVALLMLTIASTQARRQGPRSGVFQAITRVINKEKVCSVSFIALIIHRQLSIFRHAETFAVFVYGIVLFASSSLQLLKITMIIIVINDTVIRINPIIIVFPKHHHHPFHHQFYHRQYLFSFS